MIEGAIQGYHNTKTTGEVTISYSVMPSAELLHRLGHKVYVLTEDEYQARAGISYEAGFEAGYSKGLDEGEAV